VSLREATPDDAPQLAELLLAARAHAITYGAANEEGEPDALLVWAGRGS
jgi:hypothetical protein